MNAASDTLSSAQNGDIASPLEWPEGIPIPESFICPLSRRLMVHPVIDKEGNSYERDAIKIYLTATEGMSPTNQQLNMSDLIENRGLKMAIEVALKSAHEQKKSKSRGPVLKRFSLARRRSSLSRESSGRSNQSSGGRLMVSHYTDKAYQVGTVNTHYKIVCRVKAANQK